MVANKNAPMVSNQNTDHVIPAESQTASPQNGGGGGDRPQASFNEFKIQISAAAAAKFRTLNFASYHSFLMP